MRVLTFINHKGGVAKTTSVACIGRVLAQKGYKVLLIDLDAQANLTESILITEPVINVAPKAGLYEALVSNEPNPVIPSVNLIRYNEEARKEVLKAQGLTSHFPKEKPLELYVLAGSLSLAGIESGLQTDKGKEHRLKNLLENGKEGEVLLREFYDYVLIDCPPSLGLLTLNAIIASDYVFIPTTAEVLPVRGMGSIQDFINATKRTFNAPVKWGGVFVTMYENRRLNKAIVKQLSETYKEAFFPTQIRNSIVIAEAPLVRQTAIEYAPESKGTEDYIHLTEEIIFRLDKIEEKVASQAEGNK